MKYWRKVQIYNFLVPKIMKGKMLIIEGSYELVSPLLRLTS